jgi:hypothetical protein
MDKLAIEELPPEIRAALMRHSTVIPSLAYSWISTIFHEVTLGDISWSKKLPARELIENTRKRFRVFAAAIFSSVTVLLLFIVLEGRK